MSPLVINPTIALPPAYRGAAPLLPDPASGGIKMPDSGRVMLTPSLAPPRTPESSMPADRRQDPVPALRLRLPL